MMNKQKQKCQQKDRGEKEKQQFFEDESELLSQKRHTSFIMQPIANVNYEQNIDQQDSSSESSYYNNNEDENSQNDIKSMDPQQENKNDYYQDEKKNREHKDQLIEDDEDSDKEELEQNSYDCNIEEEEHNQKLYKNISQYEFDKLTISRSRKRSFDNDKNKDDKYFSASRENELPPCLPNNYNYKYIQQRSMKDIQNESFKTSYHIKDSSFKWSTQLKHLSFTHKKGALNNYYQNMKQNELQQQQKIFPGKKRLSIEGTNQTLLLDTIELSNSTATNNSKQIALDSLYVFKSVQVYSEVITNFLSICESLQNFNILNQLQYIFQTELDKGSFGQVDLYLFEADNTIHDFQGLTFQEQTPNNICKTSLYDYKNQQLSGQSPQKNQNQFGSTRLKNRNQNVGGLIINSQQTHSQETTQMNSEESFNAFTTQQKQLYYDKHAINFSEMSMNKQHSKIKNNSALTASSMQKKLLPVAGKKIKNLNEFIRELYIMQTVQCEYFPSLLGQDVDQQVLFMELGLCNLYDLKIDCKQNNTKLTDDFTYQILINLIWAIESLLSNYNHKEQKTQPLFHSDIKPQNIILTVKKSEENGECEVRLLLIDFGGASFELQDYWSYFTPAFVCPNLWEKLVSAEFKKEFLTWSEVRYAEIYAACRSVQFLIVEEDKQDLFKKENCSQFIQQYQQEYPKTCRILQNVFLFPNDYTIYNDYYNILTKDEVFDSRVKQSLEIQFEAQRIFFISKLYKIINSQFLSQIEQ